MHRLILFTFCLLCLSTCDDGDIINVDLEFDGNLEVCENITSEYIVYDINTDPSESLSLIFPRTADDELLFNPIETPYVRTYSINGGSVRFNYRTYNQTPEFCNSIPDPDIMILEDYEANGGTVTAIATFIDSDDDGIPNEDEGADPNGDGDFSDSLDTDGDGIFNYIDRDDDNDNVFTEDEDDNEDGDNNPFTNPRDTDGDGIPDYLENDDDDDGTPTRLEDEDEDGNPLNDFLNDGDELPRYRDNSTNQAFGETPLRTNFFTRTITTTFTIDNLGLEILNAQFLDFGTYEETITSEVFDPNE
ncbi:hypothetical protein [Winogradskyella ursingii]|uniref:hypothetical protein n=1 Tax=Winogradskyella ursingii TaxID=2686079 RepID=UPI0015CEEDED|nr:hypothetical protein [Winogradskyella ursingii]